MSRTRTNFERPSREGEHVAGTEPGDEVLLHRADGLAPDEADLHRRLAHDGPDGHPVPHGCAAVADDVEAVPLDHLVVLGIRTQRRAAAGDEVHDPAPFGVGQIAIRPGGAYLRQQLVGTEPSAYRDRDGVLRQQIERTLHREARLDGTGAQRIARGGDIDQLQRIGGNTGQPADRARLVAAPAGALNQAAHGLGASDLEHPVHRGEVDAEVEGRGADHAAEPAVPDAVFHPFPGVAVQRAMMQRDDPGPVGPRLEQCLKPELGRGPGVGEDERGLALLDRADHFGQQPETDLPRPGKPLHGLRNERVHLQRLGDQPAHDAAGRSQAARGSMPSRVSRAVSRFPSVAESPQVRRPGRQRRSRARASSV